MDFMDPIALSITLAGNFSNQALLLQLISDNANQEYVFALALTHEPDFVKYVAENHPDIFAEAVNEHHLYGSSRLRVKMHKQLLLKEFSIRGFEEDGTYIVDQVMDSFAYESSSSYFCRVLGQKQYEMSNHLGNVLATVLDRRTGVFDEGADTLMYYVADVVSATLYYPFGSSMVSFSNTEFYYSYGMNTQEKDDEIYGAGNSYSAEYWHYDARLGRRWNNDPRPNPSISVYACFGNNPIVFTDVCGDTTRVYGCEGNLLGQINDEGGQVRISMSDEAFERFQRGFALLMGYEDDCDIVAWANEEQTRANLYVDMLYNFAIVDNELNGTFFEYYNEPAWLCIARNEIGKDEDNNCSDIINYHQANRQYKPSGCIGGDNAWCASFAGWCLSESGYPAQLDAGGHSYIKVQTRYRKGYTGNDGNKAASEYYSTPIWGQALNKPVIGAIAVKKSGGYNHVGFVVGTSPDGKLLYILGGNQGDAINITAYPRGEFYNIFIVPVGYEVSPSSYDLPVIKGGKSGGKVN
jgi:hypothetical protein